MRAIYNISIPVKLTREDMKNISRITDEKYIVTSNATLVVQVTLREDWPTKSGRKPQEKAK